MAWPISINRWSSIPGSKPFWPRTSPPRNPWRPRRRNPDLAGLARARKLKPEQFAGGTFCISNLGMMGIERFTAIINPPNAAILATGAIVKKPVVQDDRIVAGQRMSLFLSCDHRVVDGATGAKYFAALKELLEKPALLLVRVSRAFEAG